MKDKQGLLLVAAAALVLFMVIKKSTPGVSGAATQTGQGGLGAAASNFWSNVINNTAGGAKTGSKMATDGQYFAPSLLGISEFANGTYTAGSTYVDPGQVTYNTQTGAVTESPFSGMFGLGPTGTYGFGG
jgi:hypothetical protein